MYSIVATISVDKALTRVLIQSEGRDLLVAQLPALETAHRHALRALLEAVALWHQSRVRIVLCADDRFEWERCGLLDALGFGSETLHYEVDVVPYDVRAGRAKRIGKLGSFARERRHLRLAAQR
jgi:hypothetical protein